MAPYALRAILATAATTAGLLGVACGISRSGEGPVESSPDSGPLVADEAQTEAPVAADSPQGDDSSDVDGEVPIDSGDAGDVVDALPVIAPPEFAWYKLTETSGNIAHDSTANGYDVSLQNVTWATGANFTLPSGGSPSGGTTNVAAGLRQAPVSFTAWLEPTARSDETSNSYAITPFPPSAVSGDAPGAYGFGIGLNVWTDGTGGSAFAVENVGYTFPNVGSAPFMASVEYFVAAAIGSTTASVYVDGKLVATPSVTTPGTAATTTLSLGLHNDDTGYGTKRFYDGRMRDVRVYKRVLTAGEVAALYAQGPAL